MCPHLRRSDHGGALEENVTVLFPFDSAGFPSAGSVGKERDVSAAAAGTTNDLQMAGMARSAEEIERVFFKILARDTLIF